MQDKMCKQYLFLICSFLVLNISESAPPPTLKICKTEDSKCIKESTKIILSTFAAGLPEYKVNILDPVKVKSINATEGNLLFVLNDVTVVGLKNCEPKKISRDKVKSQINIELPCSVTLDGTYTLKGSVLVVPLRGNGKIHVDLKSAIFRVAVDMVDKTGADGKKHWHAKSFQFNFDLKEKSNLVFENLNKGNELLERAGTALIESNSNEVIKEIGFPVIQAVMNIVVKNINQFFKALPAEELSLD